MGHATIAMTFDTYGHLMPGGLDEAAAQTRGGLLALLLAFSVVPAISYLVSAVMIWRFPINRKRQRAIVRAIERRERRSNPPGVPVRDETAP